jgi:hypothetical protein
MSSQSVSNPDVFHQSYLLIALLCLDDCKVSRTFMSSLIQAHQGQFKAHDWTLDFALCVPEISDIKRAD